MHVIDWTDEDARNRAEWDFVLEHMECIEQQAKHCYRKMTFVHVYYDYGDLVQEGIVKAKSIARKYVADRGKSIGFVRTSVVNHLLTMMHKAMMMIRRERVFSYQDDLIRMDELGNLCSMGMPEEDRIATKLQKKWLDLTCLKVNVPLSYTTFAFCKCLLDPPKEFQEVLSRVEVSKSPWKDKIETTICDRLGMPRSHFAFISAEIKHKCELEIVDD